jgi:DNA invertase Pin-like site-specific DNA recombinase
MGSASIYLRVSTAGQAAEGVSLEAQEARARKWADANGYTVAGLHCDAGISGKRTENRPGLQTALAEVCRTRGALIVYSLSRPGPIYEGRDFYRRAAGKGRCRPRLSIREDRHDVGSREDALPDAGRPRRVRA